MLDRQLLGFRVVKTEEEARRLASFLQAVEKGDADVVKTALREGMDPNRRVWMESMLTLAARKKRATVIEVLLEGGANPNADRGAPLGLAVGKGDKLAVKALIAAGANANLRAPGDSPALIEACRTGDEDIARMLIAAGADLNKPYELTLRGTRGSTRATPLIIAAWNGHVGLVEMLLKAGARTNAKDSSGRTALQWARGRAGPGAKKIAGLLEQHQSGKERSRSPLPVKLDFSAAANSAAFRSAVAGLEKLTGQAPRPLQDDDGAAIPGGVSFPFKSEIDAKSLAAAVQIRFLRKGFFVFQTKAPSGGAALGILPSADQFSVITAVQTNGANCKLSNRDLVGRMRKLEKTQPFLLLGVGFDFLAGRFTTPVKDAVKLAKWCHGFCPDVEDVEMFSRQISKTGEFLLWWG